jgi:hypothetical protein
MQGRVDSIRRGRRFVAPRVLATERAELDLGVDLAFYLDLRRACG